MMCRCCTAWMWWATLRSTVDKEHGECTVSLERFEQQSTFHTLSDAAAGLSQALGTPVQAIDLSSVGYEFVGAGQGHMPLDEQPSGHLLYRKMVNGKPGPMASIFIAPVKGCCKSICSSLRPGEWAPAGVSSPKACKRRIVYSTDGKLVYFLGVLR